MRRVTLGLAVFSLGCPGPEPPSPSTPPRAPVTPASSTSPVSRSAPGIFAESAALDFVHFNGMSGEHSIVEEMGSGGALFDYDNDGDLDLYLVQGRMLGAGKTSADAIFTPRHPEPLSDRLYRNDLESGALGFTDVTEESGLAELALGYGIGVAAGDYDNDGWTDLYLTRYGENQLLRNLGDGTFEDTTAASGTGDDRFSVPAIFFDYDGDGHLDLWVGNYVFFPEADPPVCRDATGARDYCGPDVFRPQSDRLLRNRGDGTFLDVTKEAGMAAPAAPALGVLTTDLNVDGALDLYVANDGHPNRLWINQKDGTLRDEALFAGTALNSGGQAEASMGVDAADFDGDGDFDLFLTHFVTETNTLYLNDGRGLFKDVTLSSGLGPPSRTFTSFGTGAIDYDLDGREDLLIVNGAVNRIEALARRGDPFPLHQTNQLFRNLGVGADGLLRFEDVTDRAGGAFAHSEVSRGAIFGDLDNDGDTDVVVTNNSGPVRLLLNRAEPASPWLGVRLVGGPGAARDMPGARAAVLYGGRARLWRRVRIDGSYGSSNDPRILFGLGDDPRVDGVRVVWQDGAIEDFPGVALGRYSTLRELGGTRAASPR